MASRFWVGGTGTWDNSATTHWSASSGGSSGAAAPTSADTVTFDGSSGGGTVTVSGTINATNTLVSLTMGAFTGTLDFSANNPNITMGTFSGTGTGTRTINLGNGTWTITGTGTLWTFANTTGLTFNANSSNIIFSAVTALLRTMSNGATLSYSTVTVNANGSGGSFGIAATGTIATLVINAPNCVTILAGGTLTISNAFAWAGTSSAPILIESNTISTTATIAAPASSTMAWAGIRDMTFTGNTPVASNSFDLGHNSGITITAPILSASRARAFAGMH